MREGETYRQTEKAMGDRSRLESYSYKPRNAKGFWLLPEARRETSTNSPLELPEGIGINLADNFDFRLLASRPVTV